MEQRLISQDASARLHKAPRAFESADSVARDSVSLAAQYYEDAPDRRGAG